MSEANPHNVALVTGAAGSFGSALAVQLAKSGWEVVLLDHKRRKLEKLYDLIVAEGGIEPVIHVMDLVALDPQRCDEIITALQAGPGRLDALVHCAVSFDGLRPLDQIAPQNWLRQIQVNLNAPWLLSISSLELLRLSPQANLVFMGEDLDNVAGAYWGAYGVSKHAIYAMASQFQRELSNSNIRVLAVNPGPMRSPLRSRAHHSENPKVVKQVDEAALQLVSLLQRKRLSESYCVNLELDRP